MTLPYPAVSARREGFSAFFLPQDVYTIQKFAPLDKELKEVEDPIYDAMKYETPVFTILLKRNGHIATGIHNYETIPI